MLGTKFFFISILCITLSADLNVIDAVHSNSESNYQHIYQPEMDESIVNPELLSSSTVVSNDDYWLWLRYGLFFIVAAMAVTYFYVKRYYAVKIELMRLRIARDLHDDISSTLSSISFFADAIESNVLTEKERNRFSNLISDSSREAKERISDIIWVIHPQNDDWETLLLKCKRYASDVLECKGVSYQFYVDGQPPVNLNLEVKKNTWLIFKELITNIAKHANPNHVEILFKVENESINLKINDDGRGFDPGSEKIESYGLSNIKTRVKELKGSVVLYTNRESGTRWNLQLPI